MNILATLILATEAGGGEQPSGLSIILPAPAELVYGAISFVIVYLVLAKLAFPKLTELLEERGQSIQGKLEESEAKLAEAEDAKNRYEASIADARGEANSIIDEAKATAESLRRDILAKAEAEADTVRSRAQTDASAERDRALQELRTDVGAVSVQLAGKIVEKELDAATHRALVDEYIDKLSSSN